RILSLGFLCFMLFSLPMAWAQSAETRAAERQTEMKPLQIGDTIPEQLWHLPLNVVNHPTGKDTITLNDYRDKKLIVLDFWATWCGVCVASLDKVDSMISGFKDVQLLLVTNENADKIRKFRSPQYAPLFSIVERHNLKDYFPHQFIPHQVWMMDNKVIATTGNDDLTVSNIQDTLHGKWDGLSEKKDIDIDYFTPISTYAKDASAEIFTFSCFTGYMKGTGNSGHLKAGKRQTFYMLNRPIFSMYREALGIFPNRIVIESAHRANLFYKPEDGYDNVYCYQLITSSERPLDSVRMHVVHDLNRQFKLNGRFEKRKVNAYVIRAVVKGRGGEGILKNAKQMKQYSFDIFVKLLNFNETWQANFPIIIDQSGYRGKVFADNPTSIRSLSKNPDKLNSFLSAYGLSVSREEMELEMFVITDQF